MPGKVDELLVSEKGVSGERASGGEEQQEKNEGQDARWGADRHKIMLAERCVRRSRFAGGAGLCRGIAELGGLRDSRDGHWKWDHSS